MLSTGLEIGFKLNDALGLEGARPAQLAGIEISQSGLGLHFPLLDVDLYLPALLQEFLGSRQWTALAMNNEGGKVVTSLKAQAARGVAFGQYALAITTVCAVGDFVYAYVTATRADAKASASRKNWTGLYEELIATGDKCYSESIALHVEIQAMSEAIRAELFGVGSATKKTETVNVA